MGQVTITFTVNRKTGDIDTQINGIKGAGCQPIHQTVSRVFASRLSMPEVSVTATEELGEGPNEATAVGTSGW